MVTDIFTDIEAKITELEIEELKKDRERLNFILTRAKIDVDFNGIWFSVLMYKGKPIVFEGKDPLIVIDNAMAFWRLKNGAT